MATTATSVDERSTAAERPHRAAKRYIYAFGGGQAEGNAQMRDELGGKGAGLAEMTNAGLPVPPGFTITTEACNDYFAAGEQLPEGLWEDVLEAVKQVERDSGKGFGEPSNPLLVSVRSGAKFSMPGMMDTVLNLGLNEETLQGLVKLTGNERFGWDAYRRFIQMFGRIVLDIDGARFDEALERAKQQRGAEADTDLDAAALREVAEEYRAIVREATGREFPSDPDEQLDLAIKAVFASWFGKRARDYRAFNKIPDDLGTAVNVVTMVFGNMGDDSGTGVAFTRDPNTGTRELYGEYLVNAQGEDVVAGVRTPVRISQLRDEMPEVYAEFERTAERLESHYRDVQDIEFTVERGRLYILQTRSAKRTAAAAVKIAADLVEDGIITQREALARIEPAHVDQLLRDQFDPDAKTKAQRVAQGLNASPGAAVGKAVFDADRAAEQVAAGEKVVLVRIETSPDDFHGMAVSQGVLTARGGATSHAAVVARQIGKPCVAGVSALVIDYAARTAQADGVSFAEGDWISLDGSTGEVFVGALPTVEVRFEEQAGLQRILAWADDVRRLQVWTNADKPEEAEMARRYGAQGIGLCRTEHMFREGERLEIVRDAILVAFEATRAKARREDGQDLTQEQQEVISRFDAALGRLEQLQEGDFRGIFEAMSGLPVVIRLIDPPLHEFLPNHAELVAEVTRHEERQTPADDAGYTKARELLAAVESLREQNPMLGLRGCRLGLMIPDFVKMQTRAILNAAIAVREAGGDPHAEIMIPLVGHVNELSATREILEAEAKLVQESRGTEVDYKFGTMIEVPRGALTADEIAPHAEFFSFGTNDLTQMAFGYSRDDAEGGFLLAYVERKVLPENPFQTLDVTGVGALMRTAVEKGRAARPGLEIGICGEHGGDPASIAFCDEIGLDYVSCSPFRVPVARLAAAQAALAGAAERDK
ncbi:MAG: pyruvate, phosphate dikinase [Chloroflexi bacterium]|nr:pyruvate, phosphate dikinase [Chloroflexota bacterium]HEV8054229.1 pyruvate, phosphate dikinase [Candidatus Limnocylindrales bacterium]